MRVPLVAPTRPDEMWTMDFTHDAPTSGRKFRTLHLMDGYTREALAIEVDTSLPLQLCERWAIVPLWFCRSMYTPLSKR